MKRVALLPFAAGMVAGVVATTTLSTSRAQEGSTPQAAREAAPPRSAREVRGPTPYWPVQDEPPPKLFVDEALPDGLPLGVVWIQYRTENCRIVPVFNKEALALSPRVGHLHVSVDDLPWVWADTSDTNTVDIGGMRPANTR